MSKKQLRSLEEIGNDLAGVSNMPCRPDWRKPKEGTIFDEDKKKALYKEQKSSTTVVKGNKIYPNEPCPCGSGKKYKKCCGKNA